MGASILLLLVLAADPAPPSEPVASPLVLKTGVVLSVRSYSAEKGVIRFIDEKGQSMILRGEVDGEATAKAIAARDAKLAADTKAAEEAAAKAEEEAARKEAAREAEKNRPHLRPGGLSVSGGSARAVSVASPPPARALERQTAAPSGPSADRRSQLEQDIARLKGRIEILEKDRTAAQANLAIAGDFSTNAIFIRGQLQNIDKELEPLRVDLKAAQDALAKLR